jgi:RNA polymerase sigma-70 factor (ECF subfamily)
MDSTPASLLERVRHRDDAAAWTRFVELYTPVIYGWARRLGLQEADAGDLVQDVFAVLVQKMAEFRYDPGQSFRAWLKTVALNKVRERERRGGGEARLVAGHDLADKAEPSLWDEEFRRAVLRRAMQIMQNDFKPATWKACWGVIVERRPAAEVASALGITVGAVYAARFRVLARLRQELAGMLD